MKTAIALLGCLLFSSLLSADPGVAPKPDGASPEATHRYMVERTFEPGALDHLDAAVKAKVNANNAKFGVHWLMSYANAQKTRTYCVYEGPDEAAVRKAAAANGLPVDAITEVPVTLLPQ